MAQETDDGVQLWLLWKRVAESVHSAVVADVSAHTHVGEPELTVLVHLRDAGGRLRQNALTTATGWDRTRLSHLLTRMESRAYVSRTRLRNGVEIAIEPAGTAVIDGAQPHVTAAVDRHLTGHLTASQRQALHDVLGALIEHRRRRKSLSAGLGES